MLWKWLGRWWKLKQFFFFYYVQGTIIEHTCTLMHVWVSILWKQKVCSPHQIDCFYSKLSILTNRSKQLKSTGVEYTVEKNNPLLSKYCSVENSLKTFKIHDIKIWKSNNCIYRKLYTGYFQLKVFSLLIIVNDLSIPACPSCKEILFIM